MWLLKRVGWIVGPIIVCGGNNYSGVVIGVVSASNLAHFMIFGSRSRVVIWAYPHPFH